MYWQNFKRTPVETFDKNFWRIKVATNLQTTGIFFKKKKVDKTLDEKKSELIELLKNHPVKNFGHFFLFLFRVSKLFSSVIFMILETREPIRLSKIGLV